MFIFELAFSSMQVYHDSEEGQRYIQFYKLNKFPYISILDPRTGELLTLLMCSVQSLHLCGTYIAFTRNVLRRTCVIEYLYLLQRRNSASNCLEIFDLGPALT